MQISTKSWKQSEIREIIIFVVIEIGKSLKRGTVANSLGGTAGYLL